MTRPDVSRKLRNLMATISPIAIATSFGAALLMNFWEIPVDYWLSWCAFVTGFAGVGTAIVAVAAHIDMLDQLRTN